MRFIINPRPPNPEENARPIWKKLLWFLGIYLASVILVGGFVYAMRALLGLHG